MYRTLCAALILVSTAALGSTSIAVKDNSELSVTLSQSNYNRLVVKNDRIIEAVFPPNAMAIKHDEQDGSVYLLPQAINPFTLFLTTEAGRHFSVTVAGEDTLGKTIELVLPTSTALQSKVSNMKNVATVNQEIVPDAILAMLTHMEQDKPFVDVNIKRQFGKAQRWGKGLTLLPKELWNSKLLQGEKIELYNGSNKPLALSQEWFTKEGTLAIKFSKPEIKPHESALLYRVQEVQNG